MQSFKSKKNHIDSHKLERELNITLPEFYLEYMNQYPPGLNETKVDLKCKKVALSEGQFLNDSTALVDINKDIRETASPADPWPENYFVIGHDGCGNYNVIDTELKDQFVLFYDHETDEYSISDRSLFQFASRIIKETNGYNNNSLTI